jgi:type II restriction/modification system DNA methylase subunit YeeA
MGFGRQFPTVGPEVVQGIELNPYAAELARVTIWIGEIQWMRKNGFDISKRPILKPLKNIENRNALLNADGTEAAWPKADAIIGNPPFLGNKKLISGLGEAEATQLRKVFQQSGAYDLVTYWFRKAADISAMTPIRVGFVATQSIRQGANREVLESIVAKNNITDAWADEPWSIDGAAVRVSLVCFASKGLAVPARANLDGQQVDKIFSDLKGSVGGVGANLTEAKRLAENRGVIFQGPVKVGAFDISGELAREMLQKVGNPNGRPNSDVIRPWRNGMDVTRRPSDTWIIDFAEMPEGDASLYEAPFEYVRKHVKPERDRNRDAQRRNRWWRLGRSGGDFRRASAGIQRCIVTPRVAKHRIFVWAPKTCLPDSRLYAVARDDDVTFGILHSRIHEVWSLATSSRHGVGNDPTYNSASCFETFPFPTGLEPTRSVAEYDNAHCERIGAAAKRLNELRENWLNPSELVRRVPEVVAGYPDRIEPAGIAARAELKNRTLTNLYNARPAWLANAHAELDAAVAAAYGWAADISEDEALKALLALNLTRTREK